MTTNDFEALARKAGLAKYGLGWTAWESQLERFAKLVEEHTLKAIAQPEPEPVSDEPQRWPFALQAKCPDCGKPLGGPGHVHTCSPVRPKLDELPEPDKADSEGGEV